MGFGQRSTQGGIAICLNETSHPSSVLRYGFCVITCVITPLNKKLRLCISRPCVTDLHQVLLFVGPWQDMADRYSSYRTTRQDVQIIRPPNFNARSVWQAAASFRPQRHPRITGMFFIWLFGLFAIFLSPSPVKITPEKLARYDQLVLQASGNKL